MKAIYTRTIGVYDDKLGEAMEISKGLAEVRKKHYPNHEVYFSFQIGGNPRTVRETLVGEQFLIKRSKMIKICLQTLSLLNFKKRWKVSLKKVQYKTKWEWYLTIKETSW